MASTLRGYIKYAPRHFPGKKCAVLKFVLNMEDTLGPGRTVPVVVFGAKADQYNESFSPGDELKCVGTVKESQYQGEVTNELHIGDYGAGYVLKTGHRSVECEPGPEPELDLDSIPDYDWEPTDEAFELDTCQWHEPFPRLGNNEEDLPLFPL